MAESKLPYLNAYGNITKALEKIKDAETPDRFSQDFLAETLGMTGGGARPVIAYLKRTGFLGADGVPTDQYRSFRNPTESGAAAARGLRIGYAPLFKMAEAAHTLGDPELKGLVVQATGLDASSKAVRSIVGSFKALREVADPNPISAGLGAPAGVIDEGGAEDAAAENDGDGAGLPLGVGLSYTINLHLPATSEIAVFNAIFKSLRENLLR